MSFLSELTLVIGLAIFAFAGAEFCLFLTICEIKIRGPRHEEHQIHVWAWLWMNGFLGIGLWAWSICMVWTAEMDGITATIAFIASAVMLRLGYELVKRRRKELVGSPE